MNGFKMFFFMVGMVTFILFCIYDWKIAILVFLSILANNGTTLFDAIEDSVNKRKRV